MVQPGSFAAYQEHPSPRASTHDERSEHEKTAVSPPPLRLEFNMAVVQRRRKSYNMRVGSTCAICAGEEHAEAVRWSRRRGGRLTTRPWLPAHGSLCGRCRGRQQQVHKLACGRGRASFRRARSQCSPHKRSGPTRATTSPQAQLAPTTQIHTRSGPHLQRRATWGGSGVGEGRPERCGPCARDAQWGGQCESGTTVAAGGRTRRDRRSTDASSVVS